MFDTTTMSYILPIAQCDLDLSLENKGMLNAITYLGKQQFFIIQKNSICNIHLGKENFQE